MPERHCHVFFQMNLLNDNEQCFFKTLEILQGFVVTMKKDKGMRNISKLIAPLAQFV